ncbi:MAG TPA: cytochrome c1 [Stellaceae bacterium]|nr:cytochrome c1 [Stellaceae bacterium]
MRKLALLAAAGAALSLGAVTAPAQEASTPPSVKWSFDGPFGTFDRAAAQRGFQVYEEVCSRCHSMNLLHYGDLVGIGYTEEQAKAFASTKQVTDGPNDQGEMFQRPGRPSDKFVAPFPNEKAARAALNGALPPDQSLIVKARPDGPDYVHGILTGYKDPPPPGVKITEGRYYNEYFPGHQIAMPPPLAGNDVTYADGTKATLDQESRDVVTFLAWAAEPTMEQRKYTGAKVLIFLVFMTGLLFGAKRKIWADVH